MPLLRMFARTLPAILVLATGFVASAALAQDPTRRDLFNVEPSRPEATRTEPGAADNKTVFVPQDFARLSAIYKQAVADQLVHFKNFPPLPGAQISPLQEARAPQPGNFVACLRTVFNPGYFAVFFDETVTVRRAVAVDHCAAQTDFTPLPPPSHAAKVKAAETAATPAAAKRAGGRKSSLFR